MTMTKAQPQPRVTKPLTLGAADTDLPQSGKWRDIAPEQAKEAGMWGLVYQVTVTYPSGNFRDEVYVGSKSLAGNSWRSYITSSSTVSDKIKRIQESGGPMVFWAILAYAHNHKQALAIEAAYINKAKQEYGSRCLNLAQVNGGKILPNRNPYAKQRKVQPNVRYT